jgi:hypothetical protein
VYCCRLSVWGGRRRGRGRDRIHGSPVQRARLSALHRHSFGVGERAEEVRTLSDQMENPESRRVLLGSSALTAAEPRETRGRSAGARAVEVARLPGHRRMTARPSASPASEARTDAAM